MKQEKIMEALTDIGDDLLEMASTKRFINHWRRWGRTAACLALVVCLTALALPYLPIGCGSKQAATEAAPEAAPADAAPEATMDAAQPAPEPEEAPAAPAEAPAEEPEAEEHAGVQRLTFRSTYYYQVDQTPTRKPTDLGEELGTVEQADDQSLMDCPVYAVEGTTMYDNHAVDGLPAPAMIYVETDGGYLRFETFNEKTVSRYSPADVLRAWNGPDQTWVLDNFIRPLEEHGPFLFTDSAQLTEQELEQFFLATLTMNTGTAKDGLWLEADGYVVSGGDLRRQLDRFLQPGYGCAAADRHLTPKTGQTEELTLVNVTQAEDDLVEVVVSVGSEARRYSIRFGADSWRYEKIEAVDKAAAEQETTLSGFVSGPVTELTTFVVCDTYYYLRPQEMGSSSREKGDMLGRITASDDPRLVGCTVYKEAYSAVFDRFAVNGQAVTQNAYVETPDGYLYATTCNEKTVSRWTYADVQTAVEKGDDTWFVQEFLRPLMWGPQKDVLFSKASELTGEQMNTLLLAFSDLNTGLSPKDFWTEEKNYVIPAVQARWRMDRFLEDHSYDPASTSAYDETRDALFLPITAESGADTEPVLKNAELLDGRRLRLTVFRPDGVVRVYTIRFDADSWRYLSIEKG